MVWEGEIVGIDDIRLGLVVKGGAENQIIIQREATCYPVT